MALMAVTMTAGAQRNDLYSTGRSNTGKSSSPSTSQTTTVTRTPSYTEPAAPVQQEVAPAIVNTPQIIVDRDPDEYNRRYTYGTSQIQYEDGSIMDDVPTIYIHDTIYVATRERSSSYEDDIYMEGYNDAIDDYDMTRRLYRFRRYGRPYYSLYDEILWDVLYWDYYWDTDYWYFSHTYYYDPWFYDPWYYDPWYYGPYYYSSYYYYRPAHYYSYRYYSTPVYSRADIFRPNRSINEGGWDRNLSRSTTASRSAAFGSSSSRSVNTTTASRSVNSTSTESRSVAGSSASRSVAGSSSSRSVAGSSSSRSVAGSSSSRSVAGAAQAAA